MAEEQATFLWWFSGRKWLHGSGIFTQAMTKLEVTGYGAGAGGNLPALSDIRSAMRTPQIPRAKGPLSKQAGRVKVEGKTRTPGKA